MNFKVNKVFLESVLDKLMSISVKTGHQEKCASFGFIPDSLTGENLFVLRTNGEVTGVVRLNLSDKLQDDEKSMFFVKDSYLHNLVKHLPEDAEIEFTLKKNKVKVLSGSFNATWFLWEAPQKEGVRNITAVEDSGFKKSKELGVVNRKDFVDVVNRVIYAVPKFTFQANKQRIVLTKEGGRASDLYSCYQEIEGKGFNLKEPVHIPFEAFGLFKFVKNSVEDEIMIRELDGNLYFILGSDYFIYRKQEEGFSEELLKNSLPESGLGFHTEVKRLKSVIERVGSVDEDNNIIEIDLSSGKEVLIKAEDRVGNKSSEKIAIHIEGSEKPGVYKLDYSLLKDALSSVKDEVIEFEVRGNYVVLKGEDSRGIISLVQ